MSHAIHRVDEFTIAGPYTLSVRFNDGTTQCIDFRPILEGELFGPLQDLALFNGVVLDREAGILTWPNGVDFDPATLHDWPAVASQFAAMARGWAGRPRGGHPRAG